MKNFKLIFLAIVGIAIIGITSCQKEPSTSFTTSVDSVAVGISVTFTNTSENGESYLWDFGDGETSTLESPTHSYDSIGNYTVTLTAYSKNGKKESSTTETIVVTAGTVVAGSGFIYDGTEYSLTKGELLFYGVYGGISNNFEMDLFTDGISWSDADTAYIGTGNYVYLDFYSASATSPVGDYPINATPTANSVDYAEFSVGNLTTGALTLSASAVSGNVKIEEPTTGVYKVTFNIVDDSGKTITGTYTGALDYYDVSAKKSLNKNSRR